MNSYREIIKKLQIDQLILFTIISCDETASEDTVPSEHIRKKGISRYSCILQGEEIITSNEFLKEFWEQAVVEAELLKLPYLYQSGGKTIFAERIALAPELIICGGGHISLELGALAQFMEFPFTVIDDREEFVSKERFPFAKQCICKSFETALTEQEFSGNPYFIIATRGHEKDLECLEILVNYPSDYLGMIGSAKKVKKSLDYLREKGYSEEVINKIHAPIGIQIGCQTPKEIAVSIMAEMIRMKNEIKRASYLDIGFKKAIMKENEPMVLAEIIYKENSAPRGVGAKMLVGENGIIEGTIGGGMIEFESVKQAKELLGTGKQACKEYRLENDKAASLGMWCGGMVKVLFEDL